VNVARALAGVTRPIELVGVVESGRIPIELSWAAD